MSPAQLGSLIPIIIFTGLFLLIFGIYYLRNRERMAMIERGIDLNTNLPKQRQSNPAFVLTFGLLLIGSGLGLLLAYLLDTLVFFDHRTNNPALYFSLVAIFGGLGLFVAYIVERKFDQKKDL